MISGILLLSLIAFVAIVSYRRPKLEQRVIKEIPLIDWLNIMVFPLAVYFSLASIVRNVLQRPRVEVLDYDVFVLLSIGLIFLIYTFVGLSVHFVGKVLSRYFKKNTRLKIYKINEIFHGKLSHYITFVSVWMMMFILALLEVNFPVTYPMSRFTVWLIIFSGVVGGLAATKAIFYTNEWFGGYNKPLFFITLALLVVLVNIFKVYQLRVAYYPFNLFIISMFFSIVAIFVFRQALKISKLSGKRRLQKLTKLLSI